MNGQVRNAPRKSSGAAAAASAREAFLGNQQAAYGRSTSRELDEKFQVLRKLGGSKQPRPRSNSYGTLTGASRIPKPDKSYDLGWTKSNESISTRNVGIKGNVIPQTKHHDIPLASPRSSPTSSPLPLNSVHYNMDHASRGKVAIFSHKEFNDMPLREGAEVDLKNLKEALPRLGFLESEISIYQDNTYSQILDTLTKLRNEDFSRRDSLFIFVLTHGDYNDKVHAKDADYEVDRIWKPFLGGSCEGLIGKPKIFFIVACRGDRTDQGVPVMTRGGRKNSTQTDAAPIIQRQSYVLPVHADMLTIYSTLPGFYSYRESARGTWYIDALCKEIKALPAKSSVNFIDLLTAVNRRLATAYSTVNPTPAFNENKQCSSYVSTLTRNLYFNVTDK